MGELLSSLDVVNKAFKKTMRGYDPAEVDEFLDQVAGSIQSYVQQMKEFERTIGDQADKLRDYERIKGSLHEALLTAQRAAEEKVAKANRVADEKLSTANATAEDIMAEARVQAERLIKDAENSIAMHGEELKKLKQLREQAFDRIRSFAGEITSVVEVAENGWGIHVPEIAIDIMKRSEQRRREGDDAARHQADGADFQEEPARVAAAPSQTAEEKRQEISDTLNVLGIDPNLLDAYSD